MKLTNPQRRALVLVHRHERDKGVGATQFAHLMWVDDLPEEKKRYLSSNRMHGYSRKGGAFLERLYKMGLLSRHTPHNEYSWVAYYRVTRKGEDALRETA